MDIYYLYNYILIFDKRYHYETFVNKAFAKLNQMLIIRDLLAKISINLNFFIYFKYYNN